MPQSTFRFAKFFISAPTPNAQGSHSSLVRMRLTGRGPVIVTISSLVGEALTLDVAILHRSGRPRRRSRAAN